MMGDEQHVWDRQPQEPLLWYRRFEKFRLMEPVCKIALVFQQEQQEAQQSEEKRGKPRKPLRTEPTGDWYEMAKQWRWVERAAAWDAFLDKEIEEQIAVERKKVLRTRFALMHKRVEAMNALATKLAVMSSDDRNIWLKDVKAIGTGSAARQVDLVQFNEGLFREFRGFMADIAAEMGERVKRSESSLQVQSVGEIAVYLPQKYSLEDLSSERNPEGIEEQDHDDSSITSAE